MSSQDLANTRKERVSPTNPVEGDLFIQDTGDFLLLDNVDSEAQAIGVRLKTYQGEVFTDLSAGIPWMQYIFANKAANPLVIQGLLRAEILARGSVVEVPELDIQVSRTRVANIRFRGVLATGQIIGAEYAQGLV